MKLTKSQLKQIIKEELGKVFKTEKIDPDVLSPEEIKRLVQKMRAEPGFEDVGTLSDEETKALLSPDILSKEEIADLLQQIQSDPSYADVEPLSGEEIADYQYKNPALRRAWRKALANW
tara:strand:+ start:2791 stop:3147 length:357 start_codon:yes stop_codon:yes gene_type:complete